MSGIIENYYYIIKVICDNGRRTYYKIGEATNINRPNKLIEKYTSLRKNSAELLAFNPLPHNGKRRLNDKTIHANIDPTILKSVDKYTISGLLKENDGVTEFFELLDNSIDIVNYIKNLVNSIKKSQYTTNVIYNTKLEYNKDQYHLVDPNALYILFFNYPDIYNMLYSSIGCRALFIGQFDFDFIASIAMFHNVTIWHDAAEQKHDYSYAKINDRITYINTFGELLMADKTDFDIIISNSPYGKVGREVTHNIIDNINYKYFVNLLPANDYARDADLFKYVDINSMKPINNGFKDAAVTTHMALINKKPCLYISKEEFEIENYIDDSLKKYFYENINRKHYAIDSLVSNMYKSKKSFFDNRFTFIMAWRDGSHKHFPYDTKCSTYKWNVEKSIDINYLYDNHKANNMGLIEFTQFTFNTEKEKDNFTKFIYSRDGFRFISKVFVAQNQDGAKSSVLKSAFPKVDWAREWTVEEILADYGYTEKEIKEVMDDLNRFKYMED